MNTRLTIILVTLAALGFEPVAVASRIGEAGGNRSGGQGISRPSGGGSSGQSRPSGSGANRPSASRPSTGGGSRLPSSPPAQRPAQRPETRPQRPPGSSGISNPGNVQRPQNRPQNPSPRPQAPTQRPQVPTQRPQPAPRPQVPTQRPQPAPRPQAPVQLPQVPAQRPQPVPRPQVPTQRPPVGGDFIGMRPDRPGDSSRPNIGNRPGSDGANRPTTLPGNIADSRPTRPGIDNRPDRPNIENRPGVSNRPDFGNTRPGPGDRNPNLDNRPGNRPRPERPNRPDRWQNVQDVNNNQWNSWRQNNTTNINNFQINRTTNWNSINVRVNQPGWARRYGTADFNRWRVDVRSFRIGRGWEIWGARRPFWNNAFDNHWWGSVWWRPRPIIPIGINISPWWWWRPFAWTSVGVFFGSTIASQPITYDPGTTVIFEGDTFFVNGEPAGTATEARIEARELALPEVAEIPVPEPPMDGQPEEWLPLGVWALTQQEQGDATMFVQLSIDKDGIVGGAFKNIMTGDEQPVIGRLDKKTQRVAWHFGEATRTVYETGLSSLQGDVASVFVHFGEEQTQTWLLVRLPSPEIPPGTVTLPEIAQR